MNQVLTPELELLAAKIIEQVQKENGGNHGRIGKDNDVKSSFDTILYHMVRFATQNAA